MKFDSHLRARDVEALVYSQFANPRSAVTDPENGSGWASRLTSMASAAGRSISVFYFFGRSGRRLRRLARSCRAFFAALDL